MTRFLSPILDESQSEDLNGETERVFAYHQATKHTYHSVRSSAHYLDWKNQPNPFRTYEGAPLTVLSPDPGFPSAGTFATMGALGGGIPIAGTSDSEGRDPARLDAMWLSRLLWHSMA